MRLVVTSGPCVTFSLRSGSKQRRRSSRLQPVGVQPTPLRTQHRGSLDETPLGSPNFRRLHLPGYSLMRHGAAVDSPSELPMAVMRLDCMPPPPYTPEVPSRHRLLAKGGEGHEPQGTPSQIEALDIPNQEEQLDIAFQQELQGTHHQLGSQNITHQQQPQDNPYEEKPVEYHFQEFAMEVKNERQPLNTTYLINPIINDDDKAGFKENMANAFQVGNITEQNYAPNPVMNATPREEKILSEENEALINETTREMSTGLDPATGNNSLPISTSSQLPVARTERESFLSQIRQFNKAKLKKQASCPESNSCLQLQSISSESNCTSDELRWGEDGKESIQCNDEKQNVDATNLLSVLKRVMKNRARSLHDTLSSTDEGNSSNDDDDDEWEL